MGSGHLTALAFTAAVDVPERFKRSRDLGAYMGLVPRRYQSGEVDYTGSISKCGDRRMRTLLYEAANVTLTRNKGPLKLKDWALAIAKRSTLRKARIALARGLAIIMHAMLRHGTEFKTANRFPPTSLRAQFRHLMGAAGWHPTTSCNALNRVVVLDPLENAIGRFGSTS